MPASLVLAEIAAKPGGLEVRTETLDARITSGRLVALSELDITLKTKTGDAKIALSDLAEMTVAEPADPMTVVGRAVVLTSAGQYVTAAKVTAVDGKVNFTNSVLGKITFAFPSVAALYLPTSSQSAADVARKCLALELGRGDQDIVVVARKTGGWLGVQGILKSIDDKMLTFSWKGTDRKISLAGVRAVFVAPTGDAKTEKFKGVVTLRDGSSVRFASLTYGKSVFNISLSGSGDTKTAAGNVATVKFVSDRVVNLSDLTPHDVKQHGLLDTSMRWRTNSSVSGGAITLGGRSYSTGLGLHSFCELTYKLDARFKSLIAVVGIDDVVRPGGDAILTFLGDGKELSTPLTVTGKEKPQSVRVGLTGVKTFVVRVDFGKDFLDVGDHVDLAGARLIK
ncbi:MAG: NPCBM/NEW2 domain-containing protein [Phycisphaerae bacterium]|nr:NPCBM/NEW2 domain-containing protein [Phycisphaerae bacterium]